MTLEAGHGIDFHEGSAEGFFTLPLGAEEMAEHFAKSIGAEWTGKAWHRFLTRAVDSSYRWIILRADSFQEKYSEKYRVSIKFANDVLPAPSRNSPIERAMEMLNVDLYWASIGKPEKVHGKVKPAPLALVGTNIETHQALVVAMPEFFSFDPSRTQHAIALETFMPEIFSSDNRQGTRPSIFAIGRMF